METERSNSEKNRKRKRAYIEEWFWEELINKNGKKYYKKKWPITKKLSAKYEWHWKTLKSKKGKKLRVRVISKKAAKGAIKEWFWEELINKNGKKYYKKKWPITKKLSAN